MDDLIQLLREQAADADDTVEGSWALDVNSDATLLKTATKKLSASPEEAWAAATELRDAIVGLGYKLYGTCQVGTISEQGPGTDSDSLSERMPIVGWRGLVELLIETR